MKNGICAALVLVALAVVAFAVPMTAPAEQPYDVVKGTGQNNPSNPSNIARFQINARSNPDGSEATGHVMFTTIDSKAAQKGVVVCMRVEGTRATIVTRWEKIKNAIPNAGAILFVEDNGKKIQGQPVDDLRSSGFLVDNIPAECPPPEDPGREPNSKGNITVLDR